MTIKQQGGIFGRNPTFNNVNVDGTLTVDQIVEKTGAAGITLDGVTLKDGNVVLADGKGIDFSATAGTGTSELFDDYEEGVFSPTLTTDGTDFDSVTYFSGFNGGKYIKVGSLVTVQITLGTNAVTVGSASGNVRIGNLPFVNGSNSSGMQNGLSSCAVSQVQGWTTNNPNAGRVNAGASTILLYYRSSVNGAVTALPVSSVSTGAASNVIVLTASYITV
jgi:hypothetical protein